MQRTHEEIVQRLKGLFENPTGDIFGTEIGDLLVILDYDDAKQFLREGVRRDEWEPTPYVKSLDAAREYLPFAIGKIDGHRGLSSLRSTFHFRAWIFLHGTDEQLQKYEDLPYEQYGAPKIKYAAEVLGVPEMWDRYSSPESRRMAEGLICREAGCDEGCGE